MTQYNQLANWPVRGGDQTMGVYSTTTAIAAKRVVKYDTSNPGGPSTPRGALITSSDVGAIGITMVDIPVAITVGGITTAGTGIVRRLGMATAVASATIHVGDFLMSDSAGKVLPSTAGKYVIGIAESEAVSGDDVNVWIAVSKNA